MGNSGKFAPEININNQYLIALKALEYDAYRWGLAAHGMRPSYNNPIGKILAKDLQAQAIDKYFSAIEQLIPKTEGEPA